MSEAKSQDSNSVGVMLTGGAEEKNGDRARRARINLPQMATIDLGSLGSGLEPEDHHMMRMNRSKSSEDPYPGLRLVQKKDDWLKISPKDRRKAANRGRSGLRRSQSLDHSECDDSEHRVYKLPSDSDIRETSSSSKSFEYEDVEVSDIYVKVPVKS